MAQVGLLEDNMRIARLCATMLQYAGHDVTIYEHPRECLRVFASVSDYRPHVYRSALVVPLPVDILMLDLHLPDISGIEVLRYLRAHPHTRSLPLIFCTAAAPSEIAQAFSIAPDASLIEKPFTFKELMSTVTDALKTLA